LAFFLQLWSLKGGPYVRNRGERVEILT